jgi:hypothetical protein
MMKRIHLITYCHIYIHLAQACCIPLQDEQVSCPTLIDVDYRFFDPDRDIDLVKWYADRIDCAKAVACLKSRSAEDDSDNEYEQDYEDETEKDFSICCRISV